MAIHETLTEAALQVEEFIPPLLDALGEAGFRSVRSFDLRSACAPIDARCTHCGRSPCNCLLVVLLVYDWFGSPYSLTIHGTGHHCDFALGALGSKSSHEAEAAIRLIIEMICDECTNQTDGKNPTTGISAAL